MEGVGVTLDTTSIIRRRNDIYNLRQSCSILSSAALVPGNVRHPELHPELQGVSQVSVLDIVKAVRRSQHQIFSNQSPTTEGSPSLLWSQILMLLNEILDYFIPL